MTPPSNFPISNRRDAVRLARAIVADVLPEPLAAEAGRCLAAYVLEEARLADHLLDGLTLRKTTPPPRLSEDDRPTRRELDTDPTSGEGEG